MQAPNDYDPEQDRDVDEGPSESSGDAYNGICLGMVFSKIGNVSNFWSTFLNIINFC